ncbi:hypothetical protein NliqN6_2449 [Naganishia liquefaciens]|uniref:Membrane insertase YidC/Oxa/ALB C-terminal domain-containing protein n=1 Tax=Naganishia liquefaciens TaxID=104408 RepID=A0A8H3TRV5_9TREE|nr:hypothetical protein NliqN6_2449 [Naganishia liquefaciens]
MLASRSITRRPRRPLLSPTHHHRHHRRRHASFLPALPALPSLTSLSELLLAHPLPTYTSTIVLLTLGVRTAFTLPATVWARQRMQRMRELVRPEMQRVNDRLAVEVARESKRKRLGYDEYKKELKKQLATAQSALFKQHHCHPLATALVPPLIHIPIFLLLSLTIRQASALATPQPIDLSSASAASAAPIPAADYTAFASEHVGWLTSLVEPDPRMIIPFAIGLMAFTNVEVMQNWRRAGSHAVVEAAPTTPTASATPTTKIRPNFGRLSSSAKHRTTRSPLLQNETDAGNLSPQDARRREVDVKAGTMRERVVGNVMRILAVVTVGIAAEVPAAVAIYWFTSTGYTLVQNIVLGYLDRRAASSSAAAAAAQK